MLTSMGILAQRFPGEDFSGRDASGQTGPMVADTVKNPPLSLKYYQIRDIGYTVLTADTLATRPPFADLQNDDIHHQRLGNMFSATLPVRFSRPVSPGNKIGIKSYHIYDRHARFNDVRERGELRIVCCTSKRRGRDYVICRYGERRWRFTRNIYLFDNG